MDKKNSEKIDLSAVDKIIASIGTGEELVIPILQAIQKEYKYLPKEALEYVCEITDIKPSSITGVSTFYSQFRHVPVGKHIVSVCVGTACHVKGAGLVIDALYRHLNIEEGGDTDPNGLFTIERVACLGCCTLAPVVQIDGITFGHITPEGVPKMLDDFLEQHKQGISDENKNKRKEDSEVAGEIRIGQGSCCVAGGSGEIGNELEKTLLDIKSNVSIKRVGCIGMCHQTPLVEVVKPDKTKAVYAKVKPEDVKEIVLQHFEPKNIFKRTGMKLTRFIENIYTDDSWEPVTRYAIDVRDAPVAAFLDRQKHIATEHGGLINPMDIEEYLFLDGFKAAKRCIKELSPTQVIEEVKESGVRGRGGAGFPSGIKWSFVNKAVGDQKYIVCNGDEGDPGAFMDRMLLESYPFRIIEGMIIAAYAVGASKGYFYIRAEYPLAVLRIREALKICEEKGFLGKNIFGTEFSLQLKIMEGAGAFVCGEETALLESIEGKRGMPRVRPPFPAHSGLWGKPTLINNTETYALIPWILRHEPGAFAKMGTEKSKGTKVFAMAGKINRGGLIEVPMGITLRQIVEDIGGGIAGGKKLKAVQIGGPSGGCIPEHMADITVDYESLTGAGAMMGSGGLVVLDESDCMVDIARYFLSFTQDQSCGKCTFCRIGTRRMLDILENLCEGKGKEGDIEKLEELAENIKKGSLCGLGKTAPNPVLSTIKHFRHEYEAHIKGYCPAKKCKELISYEITDDCIGCTICAQKCPVNAIELTPYKKHFIIDDKCTRCNTCLLECPSDAIILVDKKKPEINDKKAT